MINSNSQSNLTRTSLYLAAGVGIGLAAVAARQFVINSGRKQEKVSEGILKKGQKEQGEGKNN